MCERIRRPALDHVFRSGCTYGRRNADRDPGEEIAIMGYICKSAYPPDELTDFIRKTLIPGEYVLTINLSNQMILCGLDTRNPKYAIWEWDFYEWERYVELCAVYSADDMLKGETAFNLMKGEQK